MQACWRESSLHASSLPCPDPIDNATDDVRRDRDADAVLDVPALRRRLDGVVHAEVQDAPLHRVRDLSLLGQTKLPVAIASRSSPALPARRRASSRANSRTRSASLRCPSGLPSDGALPAITVSFR